jgi:hypothetical protein
VPYVPFVIWFGVLWTLLSDRAVLASDDDEIAPAVAQTLHTPLERDARETAENTCNSSPCPAKF